MEKLAAMELFELCENLRERNVGLKTNLDWPTDQLKRCGEAGVFKWFIQKQYGGSEWTPQQIVEGYIQLAAACLTTSFVISQRTAACKRIEDSNNNAVKRELLPKLATGEIFATVGLSHLTTSHRHLERPALLATKRDDETWNLDGFSPWVTGGQQADFIVAGAETESRQHVFFAVPTHLSGIRCEPGFELSALAASQTGRVNFRDVNIDAKWLIQPPQVSASGSAINTGGLQTTALALGLATAAVGYLQSEAKHRSNLTATASALHDELHRLKSDLFALANGDDVCDKVNLRASANSLAVRSTQAAMVAAKGAGFVKGHPVGRWCAESLFFLVWSCPQQVSDANLFEFAGQSA